MPHMSERYFFEGRMFWRIKVTYAWSGVNLYRVKNSPVSELNASALEHFYVKEIIPLS